MPGKEIKGRSKREIYRHGGRREAKDGYSNAKTIEATDPTESQTVTVRGTKALRKDKKPVKATWY